MWLITEGGLFAWAIVAWSLLCVPILAFETRGSPRWFPGLHTGLATVMLGLGAAGWLMGLENVAVAMEDSGHRVMLGATGSSIAPYPMFLSLLCSGILTPWMLFNSHRQSRDGVRQAPAIPVVQGLGALLLFLSMCWGFPAAIGVLQALEPGELLPVAELELARWFAVAALPLGLLNIVLAFPRARPPRSAVPVATTEATTAQRSGVARAVGVEAR